MRKIHMLRDTEELIYGISLCGWEFTKAQMFYALKRKPRDVNCKRCLAKMDYNTDNAVTEARELQAQR